MNLFFKPAIGADGKPLLVRDPLTQKPLAVAGEWKINAPYWIRRMHDKEVIDATAEQKPAIVAPAAPMSPAAPSPAPAAPVAVPAAPAAPTVPPTNLIS